MQEWTVIMMLEGSGDARCTLAIAYVKAESLEEAVLEAWEPFAMLDDPQPACVGLIVQKGENRDMAEQMSSWLRAMLNV